MTGTSRPWQPLPDSRRWWTTTCPRSVAGEDNVTELVEGAVEAVGATPEEFLEWIKADRRHLALFGT